MLFFVLVELDFESVANMVLVFNASQQEINVFVNIVNDAEIEDPEEFTASLVLLSNNVSTEVNPSQANVRIISDDRKLLLLSSLCDLLISTSLCPSLSLSL